MTDPAQIPNMDAKQIAELHVIERYLADQLTDEEAHAFEAYVEAHPEVTRDIENISRMKAGLASLRQRGELAPLLVAERPRKPLWLLLAAAAAAVLVAVLVVPRYLGGGSNLPVLAASAQQLLGENEKPLPISARLLVGRARGATPNTLAAPRNDQGVELRLDVHADEPVLVGPALEVLQEGEIAQRHRSVWIVQAPVVQRVRGVRQHRRAPQARGDGAPGHGEVARDAARGRSGPHVGVTQEREHEHRAAQLGVVAQARRVELGQAVDERAQAAGQDQPRKLRGQLVPRFEARG